MSGPTRSPGGIFYPDPETRDELLSPPKQPKAGAIPASTVGTRYAVRPSSHYFITDTETCCADLWDPYILVTSRELWNHEELVPLLEEVARAGAPLLVAAPAVRGDALVMLIANKLRGVLYVAAIDAPPATLATIATIAQDIPPMIALSRVRRAIVSDDELLIVR